MPSRSARKASVRKPDNGSAGWSPAARTIATVVLILHLAAVVVAPWSGPPPSELSQKVASVFRPYLQMMHLDHGYRFFAPDPPLTSNLVRYKLEMPAGSPSVMIEGTFPNREIHTPRLAYHRHFMITSQVFERVALPDDVLAEMPPAFFDETGVVMQSIAGHLMYEHGAQSVKLYLKRHRVPRRQAVIEGMQLTDESLYIERFLGTLTSDGTWHWSEQIRGKRNGILQ